MADLIDRQAAIDAVCMEWCGVKHQDCEHPFDIEKDDYYWCDGCETALRTLPNLPSAQQKHGKWKTAYLDHEVMGVRPRIYYCSVCCQCIAYPTNFCPNCGTDMRGDTE